VDFDRIWAPWRMEYVQSGAGQADDLASAPEPAAWREGSDRSCFLCRAAATFDDSTSRDRELLVVARTSESVVVLNRYPYNNGHALVAPRRHVGEFEQLTPAEHSQCAEHLARLIGVFRSSMNAEGFNIGLNLGRVAGAGVPGHLHWHIVPRWSGDHNFMPVLAGAHVIPQSLDAVWQLLMPTLSHAPPGRGTG
jgi:ATP adenylyltransferase